MTKFIKGQSGNPAGKPKGAKDKKWASLDYWMSMINADLKEVLPETRVKIALDAWKALLPRRKLPPETEMERLLADMDKSLEDESPILDEDYDDPTDQ